MKQPINQVIEWENIWESWVILKQAWKEKKL